MAKRLLSPRNFYRVLHNLSDKRIGPMERAFLKSIQVSVDSISVVKLQAMLAIRSVDGVFQAINLNGNLKPTVRAAMARQLRQVFNAAGTATATLAPPSVHLRFDVTNPRAVKWAQQHAAELVTEVSNNARTNIRRVVARGFREGNTVDAMAREIRSHIGLTTRFSEAVENLRERLIDEGVDAETVAARAERYAAKLLRYRARVISRHETQSSSNGGQQELWQQAADDGLIDPAETRRIAITTPDDRLCEICEPIPSMNPDGVALDEPFETPEGPMDAPPFHVQCRCAMALQFGVLPAQAPAQNEAAA